MVCRMDALLLSRTCVHIARVFMSRSAATSIKLKSMRQMCLHIFAPLEFKVFSHPSVLNFCVLPRRCKNSDHRLKHVYNLHKNTYLLPFNINLKSVGNFHSGLVLGIACDTWASVNMVPMTPLASVEDLHVGLLLGAAYDAWASVHMPTMTSLASAEKLHFGLVLRIACDAWASVNMAPMTPLTPV